MIFPKAQASGEVVLLCWHRGGGKSDGRAIAGMGAGDRELGCVIKF
jgi:hypothetical protein